MVKVALELKHPPHSEPSPEAFVLRDDLPVLIDVDVTAAHVQTLSDPAGIEGLDSQQ